LVLPGEQQTEYAPRSLQVRPTSQSSLPFKVLHSCPSPWLLQPTEISAAAKGTARARRMSQRFFTRDAVAESAARAYG
jgi:hypothetical protein